MFKFGFHKYSIVFLLLQNHPQTTDQHHQKKKRRSSVNLILSPQRHLYILRTVGVQIRDTPTHLVGILVPTTTAICLKRPHSHRHHLLPPFLPHRLLVVHDIENQRA